MKKFENFKKFLKEVFDLVWVVVLFWVLFIFLCYIMIVYYIVEFFCLYFFGDDVLIWIVFVFFVFGLWRFFDFFGKKLEEFGDCKIID